MPLEEKGRIRMYICTRDSGFSHAIFRLFFLCYYRGISCTWREYKLSRTKSGWFLVSVAHKGVKIFMKPIFIFIEREIFEFFISKWFEACFFGSSSFHLSFRSVLLNEKNSSKNQADKNELQVIQWAKETYFEGQKKSVLRK